MATIEKQSDLNILAEQTGFLLEKQKEVLAFFRSGFRTLCRDIEVEQKKAEQANAGAALASFQSVFSMLSTYEKESVEVAERDIRFLEEQLSMINSLSVLEDERRAEEITGMMLDEGHKLEETKKFMADVEAEAEEAKENFRVMVDDITATLAEEGVGELEKLLSAFMAERDEEEDDEECGSSCHSCPGCNVFEGIEIAEEEKKKK